MKKILVSILCLMGVFNAFASDNEPSGGSEENAAVAQALSMTLPMDTSVKYGKLPNGLTYYIRKNDFVPSRAEFYIVQNVGSILEEPTQRGLAHFLEHMAFHGTRNFSDKGIIDYLEKLGVRFGADLNAYTGIDETVYMLSEVPVTRSGVVDSCLMILRDWSDGILLEDEDIDKERRVIEEEWRTRDNASMRMLEKVQKPIYGDDKYSDCMPIGSMDVVRNFEYEALRSYYRKWYRPDLQGIVVVGDIDPDYVEAKLIETFSSAKLSEDRAERVWYPVSDNKEPIVVYAKDKETSYVTLAFFQKHENFPDQYKNTVVYLKLNYLNELADRIMNQRFQEIAQEEQPPFVAAGYSDDDFLLSKTKQSYTIQAVCSETAIETCLKRVIQEYEIMRRYGFTQSELDWATETILNEMQNAYNERNRRQNYAYVSECIMNFKDSEPLLSIEDEYELTKLLASSTTLGELNSYVINDNDENKVVWFMGPETDNYEFPSADRVTFLMDSIGSANLSSYEESVSNTPLISDYIFSGSVVEKNALDDGVTKYVLSNGVKVFAKPTNFKNDQILMEAEGEGAMALEDVKDAATFKSISDIATLGGLGDLDETQLNKFLATKQAGIQLSFDVYTKGISGESSVKDFETLLQLVYLQLTDIREDEKAFLTYKNKMVDLLRNYENQPVTTFLDSIKSIEYGNHPFATRITTAEMDSVDYHRGLEILRQHLSSVSDFSFVFTGNIDNTDFENLICKYLASIPSVEDSCVWQNCGYMLAPGDYYTRYDREMETPKSSIYISMHDAMPYTLKNEVTLDALTQILDIVYFESVRERAGGTYGVNVVSDLDRLPYDFFNTVIVFECEPYKVDTLLPIISGELEDMALKGPSLTNLNKVKEYMLKVYNDNQQKNEYWQKVIMMRDVWGIDLHSNYEETVKNLTVEDIRQMAALINSHPNYKEIIQMGVQKTDK